MHSVIHCLPCVRSWEDPVTESGRRLSEGEVMGNSAGGRSSNWELRLWELEEEPPRSRAADVARTGKLCLWVCVHDALSHHHPAHSVPQREGHLRPWLLTHPLCSSHRVSHFLLQNKVTYLTSLEGTIMSSSWLKSPLVEQHVPPLSLPTPAQPSACPQVLWRELPTPSRDRGVPDGATR